MKHTPVTELLPSTVITSATVHRLSIATSGLQALIKPVHVLNILDRIAAAGDRVRITGLEKADDHFLFHPNDIDFVFRRNHKKLDLARRQKEMLHEPHTSIKPTIINSSGPEWRQGRKVLAKHMHPTKGLPQNSLDVVSDEINGLVQSWQAVNEIGLAQESSNLFIRLAYRVMFNQKAPEGVCEALGRSATNINRHQFTVALTNGFLKSLSGQVWGLAEATNQFNAEISAVRERYLRDRTNNRTPVLLDDMSEDVSPEITEARIAMMIRASHTTMTYTLFNAIWQLAAHPDYQERIARANTDDPILTQVMYETMRLTPPIHFLPKDAQQDIELKDGYLIKAGDTVSLSPYITNRDPRFYKAPLSFAPEEHFSDLDVEIRHPDAFIPYGVGPRKCPGRAAAEQQIQIALQKICENFRFARVGSEPATPSATILMLPDKRSKISLQPR